MDKTPAEDLEEVRERLEVLQSLLKFPPWERAVELIAKQIVARDKLNTKPVDSIGGMLTQNYDKGIVQGLKLAISYPRLMADSLQEEFNAKLQEQRLNGGEQ